MNMARKVLVALFDKDLRCEIEKYPLNSDGTKIEITQRGRGAFMPEIDNDSCLWLPQGKKYFLFGPKTRVLTPVYFAMKWAKKCVNFHIPEVRGPDPEEVIKAARAEVIKNYGKGKLEIPWYLTVMLAIILILVVLNSRVLGVF